jgi:hypothetical protein
MAYSAELFRSGIRAVMTGLFAQAKVRSGETLEIEGSFMIVIHVGLKKAGSTSIQVFLSDNEEILQKRSVEYPKIGRRGPAHHEIVGDIKRRPGIPVLQELSAHWTKSPHATMVLSSEMFEDANARQITALRKLLLNSNKNDDFRIVIIVRDLIDLMPSSYAQRTKFGGITQDFDVFFEERMKTRRINYFQTAKRWADVFGWGSIRVRVLDRRYLLNANLLDDFMDICGIRLMEDEVPMKRPLTCNTSPGWKTVEAVRALFGGRHGLPAEHGLAMAVKDKDILGLLCIHVGNKLGWNDDRGSYLTRDHAQRCFETYLRNVEAFNKQLLTPIPQPLDLEARGFRPREFLPDATCIPAADLRAFYEEVETLRKSRKRGHGRLPREARLEARKLRGRGTEEQEDLRPTGLES